MTIPHALLSSLRSSRQTTLASSKLWFGLVVVAVTTLLSAPTAEGEGVIVDVVMVDLARIPQSETRQIAQDDIVVVVGFIRRPGHRVIATSVQPISRWFPTTPAWMRPGP